MADGKPPLSRTRSSKKVLAGVTSFKAPPTPKSPVNTKGQSGRGGGRSKRGRGGAVKVKPDKGTRGSAQNPSVKGKSRMVSSAADTSFQGDIFTEGFDNDSATAEMDEAVAPAEFIDLCDNMGSAS